jgi:hypothetical protein
MIVGGAFALRCRKRWRAFVVGLIVTWSLAVLFSWGGVLLMQEFGWWVDGGPRWMDEALAAIIAVTTSGPVAGLAVGGVAAAAFVGVRADRSGSGLREASEDPRFSDDRGGGGTGG